MKLVHRIPEIPKIPKIPDFHFHVTQHSSLRIGIFGPQCKGGN